MKAGTSIALSGAQDKRAGVLGMMAGAAVLLVAGADAGASDPAADARAESNARARVNARTRATPKMKPTMKLPPPGDTYRVIGQVRDLKMYVVEYDKTLYRGGEPVTRSAVELLRRMGVKTIISISPTDAERMWAGEFKLSLVEVPFRQGDPVPAETLRRFLEALRKEPGPFYLHGFGGTHRGGVLAAAYRVRALGWDFEKARDEFYRLGGNPKTDAVMLGSVVKQQPAGRE